MADRYENIRQALALLDSGDYCERAIGYSKLRNACRPDTIRELLAERDQLAAALEAAREDVTEAKQNGYELGLLAGAQEAERLRGVIARYERKLDAAIDQARGKGGP